MSNNKQRLASVFSLVMLFSLNLSKLARFSFYLLLSSLAVRTSNRFFKSCKKAKFLNFANLLRRWCFTVTEFSYMYTRLTFRQGATSYFSSSLPTDIISESLVSISGLRLETIPADLKRILQRNQQVPSFIAIFMSAHTISPKNSTT